MAELSDLIKKFEFSKVLKSEPSTKTVVLFGNIGSDAAIIALEKSHFNFEFEDTGLDKLIQDLKLINLNDVYHWSNAILFQDLDNLPSSKLNLIYPATDVHIRKYSQQKYHYVLETPDMYSMYVVPYIESMKGDRIKWVYNILFEGKESETFIYHDKDSTMGFVLLPDMKWDQINVESLYLCCIVNRKDISSVRDLNGDHLSYLIGIQKTIKQVTCKRFLIEEDELRIFIHYHPSYYHFHIHVVNVSHPGLGDSIAVGKAILLDNVIENIKLAGDYYQKVNLGVLIGENHGLWNIDGFRNSHYRNIGSHHNE